MKIYNKSDFFYKLLSFTGKYVLHLDNKEENSMAIRIYECTLM